jgi:hypothetical protein
MWQWWSLNAVIDSQWYGTHGLYWDIHRSEFSLLSLTSSGDFEQVLYLISGSSFSYT